MSFTFWHMYVNCFSASTLMVRERQRSGSSRGARPSARSLTTWPVRTSSGKGSFNRKCPPSPVVHTYFKRRFHETCLHISLIRLVPTYSGLVIVTLERFCFVIQAKDRKLHTGGVWASRPLVFFHKSVVPRPLMHTLNMYKKFCFTMCDMNSA